MEVRAASFAFLLLSLTNLYSHHHWDHLGKPSVFPTTTELVVGPGFKEELLPAYPTNESSLLRDSDFE